MHFFSRIKESLGTFVGIVSLQFMFLVGFLSSQVYFQYKVLEKMQLLIEPSASMLQDVARLSALYSSLVNVLILFGFLTLILLLVVDGWGWVLAYKVINKKTKLLKFWGKYCLLWLIVFSPLFLIFLIFLKTVGSIDNLSGITNNFKIFGFLLLIFMVVFGIFLRKLDVKNLFITVRKGFRTWPRLALRILVSVLVLSLSGWLAVYAMEPNVSLLVNIFLVLLFCVVWAAMKVYWLDEDRYY